MTAGEVGFESMVVGLAGGRSLLVRRLTGDDGPVLRALYDELGPDDRRLRFFSVFPPGAAFVQRWLTAPGNLVLGAFVRQDGTAEGQTGTAEGQTGTWRLVGEAGYALLPNGNGELGITTAADWRGWLGPYLLDVLAGAAHAAGVDGLEADVRGDNDPMLGLIAHRGMAVADPPADGRLRVVMGTGGDVPGWAPGRGPVRARVVVESAGGRWPPGSAAGVEVLGCPGPAGRPGGRCPLLQGERCPLVEGADVVVNLPGSADDAALRAVAAAHRARSDGPPLEVCGSAAALRRLLGRLAGSGPPPQR